jgi:16S rRNA (guanine966-N2)-methyltransferase
VRIIAGEFRGRNLLSPEGDVTRPITDRVKQSLFDILTPLFAAESDLRVYDCFAGTGSMGLESLSRGATKATFFEVDRSAVKRLRRNIETLGVGSAAEVVTGDVFAWFDTARALNSGRQAGLIFLDPPYRFLSERSADLQRLAGRMLERHLTPDGTVVFRHDARDTLSLPGLERYDERSYGGMVLEFLRPAAQ